tara:strand:- start:1478 stop:2494 length:1017 start_codon:yes stop_codon:yes gene_type:complete
MFRLLKKILILFFILPFFTPTFVNAQNEEFKELLEIIQKDLRTLERAVYSMASDESFSISSSTDGTTPKKNSTKEEEQALAKHLLKVGDLEKQFQDLTNEFEKINFRLDKLSNAMSKIQADNQLRFQQLENSPKITSSDKSLTSVPKSQSNKEKILPGTSQPQDLGEISYKDMTDNSKTQATQAAEGTVNVISETFKSEEKILPNVTAKEQYQFATNFLKVGDYNNAEKAFREFVLTNPKHELSGTAQYWYAETYRIRQMYTDAASAYLEGYQKYPNSKIAPENLLKLGVSLVQMGQKDEGCSMIAGVKKQYPNATQSVLQKAKYYEEKKFECRKENS